MAYIDDLKSRLERDEEQVALRKRLLAQHERGVRARFTDAAPRRGKFRHRLRDEHTEAMSHGEIKARAAGLHKDWLQRREPARLGPDPSYSADGTVNNPEGDGDYSAEGFDQRVRRVFGRDRPLADRGSLVARAGDNEGRDIARAEQPQQTAL